MIKMSCNVSYLNNTKFIIVCFKRKKQRLNKIREKETS